MESLNEEIWDVVIAGTSLPQSLLALALSRSGKKVLHVDRNAYYGGDDAGFSLQDAQEWTEHLKIHQSTIFSDPLIDQDERLGQNPSLLRASRSYTLSLNPQIIYAQSRFLPTLVSSQIHSQLEFLAVGSWWVHKNGELQKIPSTREDVFNDESLSMRDKRGLMKFLRFVLQEGGPDESIVDTAPEETLAHALRTKFKIPLHLEAPLLALALSSTPASASSLDSATAAIRRHMRSVGYFGPGFGAVIAKYGGNAEVSQVACRAQAVGGGVYLLGYGIDSVEIPSEAVDNFKVSDTPINARLANGIHVRAHWVVGGADDIPRANPGDAYNPRVSTYHSIDIIPDPLKHVFPATSENGPVPAVAIILVQDESNNNDSPIYLQVHTEDTGECPSGQCVIYGSVQSSEPAARGRLRDAVSKVISSTAAGLDTQSIWFMSYTSHQPTSFVPFELRSPKQASDRIVSLPVRPHSISLQDDTLDIVHTVWTAILGTEAENQTFLRFEEREQPQDTES